MKKIITPLAMVLAGCCAFGIVAQAQNIAPKNKEAITERRCGTLEYEQMLRAKDPDYDRKKAEAMQKIEEKAKEFENAKLNGNPQPYAQYTIPIVVHVVYQNATENVSDARVNAMIAQLNADWSRTNSDAGNTPAPFQSLAANTEIQFCLATKDPAGNPTTGIVRKSTTVSTFGMGAVQSSAQGGDDPWDVNKYLNIWSCDLGSGLLGYGQFPPISSSYGTAINYCTVGSLTVPGTCGAFAYGRTLSHEIGHCFSLYHIWGDESACGADDAVSDTPMQADATSGCFSFPHTDACTPSGNGIMYMNYMDYSDDQCYNMFTTGQKNRCQSTIASYLMSIANNAATVCGPAAALDAGVSTIISPNGIACNTTFTPVVTVNNYGATTLTSCTINYRIDANPNQTFSWTGSLATGQSANVTLPSMTTTAGTHTFTSSTSNPNGSTDGNTANDQSAIPFTVSASAASLPVVEGMESATFPPTGWTINNADASTTWTRTTLAAKTGSASMFMDNFDYSASGQIDEFQSDPLNMQNATSAQLTFEVAYQLYTDPNAAQNWSDTLKVQVSTDCGSTWSTPYFKYSTNLTTATPVFSTTEFVPNASQWRMETVNLTPYLPASNMIVKFRHSCDYENNMYVDDINITSVVGVNEYDLSSSVSVYPNPSTGNLFVKLNASDLGNVSVKVYNLVGDVVSEQMDNISSPKKFQFDLSKESSGVYFVEVKTDNGATAKKVMISK